MHLFIPILAADHARELRRDAARQHLATLAAAAREPRISPIRRGLARALVAISRASAAAVRRLDACLADDLGRSLARIDGA
jgi:hypothetical protein